MTPPERQPLRITGEALRLTDFIRATTNPTRLEIAAPLRQKLTEARQIIDDAAAGETPVYGLNTGLGANLGHRVSPADIAAFQRQILEGRAVALGAALPEPTGRAVLLYRIHSAAKGRSGISPLLFDHLVGCFNAGLSPPIPQFGSIGAGDLTQLAPWALAICDAPGAPPLAAKDAMTLINHTGLTVALAAQALHAARTQLAAAHHAALLSYAGHDANRSILSPAANTLRPAPGQAEAAHWLLSRLQGTSHAPRRIQEALSFRTAAPILGAAMTALEHATWVLEQELNGVSDSPALVEGSLASTCNFHTPALALALEHLSLALSMVANAATQRMQRLMNPELSGLPKYLSPRGGASAGLVPLQKTAATLNADIRAAAQPVAFDPAPVSDSVEDMAPMTPQTALKLSRQMGPLRLLVAAEARTALQALHLRQPPELSAPLQALTDKLTAKVPPLTEDRPSGPDIEATARVLDDHCATA